MWEWMGRRDGVLGFSMVRINRNVTRLDCSLKKNPYLMSNTHRFKVSSVRFATRYFPLHHLHSSGGQKHDSKWLEHTVCGMCNCATHSPHQLLKVDNSSTLCLQPRSKKRLGLDLPADWDLPLWSFYVPSVPVFSPAFLPQSKDRRAGSVN